MSSENLRAIYRPLYTPHSGESTGVLRAQLLITKDLATVVYCGFRGAGTGLSHQKPFRTFLLSPSHPKEKEKNLTQGFHEFHADQMHTASRMLAFDLGCDGGCFWGHARTSRRRRRRNSKANGLVHTQEPSAGQKRPRGADIKRFGELEKFSSAAVYGSHKNGDLQADSRRTAALRRV